MSRFSLVVFDFDGTVFDSEKGIVNCILYALKAYGIKEDNPDRLQCFIGPPLIDAFKDVYKVNDEMAHKLVEKYRERYRETGYGECELYDGILEVLADLKKAGCKIGIASSKPQLFIEKILKLFSMTECFDVIVGTGFSKDEPTKDMLILRAMELANEVDKTRVAMVGDRHFDINGANKVGVTSVGVEYGFGSKEEFEKAGADFIVKDVKELAEFLLKD